MFKDKIMWFNLIILSLNIKVHCTCKSKFNFLKGYFRAKIIEILNAKSRINWDNFKKLFYY